MSKYSHIKTPKEAWNSAKRLRKKRRIPELEELIILDATCSYNYCLNIIQGRWPEAEKNILEKGNSKLLFLYAKNIIKNRWPEAEQKILENKEYVFQYAQSVIKNRWPEGEKVLLEKESKDIEKRTNFWNFELLKYCEEIIKDRWPEAEEILIKNPIALSEYGMDIIEDRLPENLHNTMLCYSLSSTLFEEKDSIQKYFDFVKQTEKTLKKQLKNRNFNGTVKELIDSL